MKVVQQTVSIEEFDGKKYQIKFVETFDKALITHYLHNYRNGVSKHYKKDALKSLRPDIFMVTADSQRTISTNFGIKFPNEANKGDVFVRVDSLPNRVYKYDGRKWIEIQKEQSDTYLHNQNYIKYLVEKIEKGEYDLDLLSETEKEQIELFLKNQK